MISTMNTYKKIDIYCGPNYVCSTIQRQSLKEAVQKFKENPYYMAMGNSGPELMKAPEDGIVKAYWA